MLIITAEMADKREAERLAVEAMRNKEGEMKEKQITESKATVCMVYLIGCSTDRNVLGVFLVQHIQRKPPLSIFCYCLDQFISKRERITKKFSL